VIQIGRVLAIRRLTTFRDGAELDVHSSVFRDDSRSIVASNVARSSHQVIRESSTRWFNSSMFRVWQTILDLSNSHCRGKQAMLVWCSAARSPNFFT